MPGKPLSDGKITIVQPVPVHAVDRAGREADEEYVHEEFSPDEDAATSLLSNGHAANGNEPSRFSGRIDRLRNPKRRHLFAYLKTKHFWLVLALGQVLALCMTSNNTFSSLLSRAGASIPTFQVLFSYVLLNVIYTPITIWKYGFREWARLVKRDGWRYLILAFLDVEGNYFTVLAYRYTNIMSAQLISFWAIIVVVLSSLVFLGVRYHTTQYLGVLLCIGGMGILIASDRINGANASENDAPENLKGDLFALLGATFYGISNCFEEYLVSKRPLYEVVGQHGFWAMLISGTQAAVLERRSFAAAIWSPRVGVYLASFTISLSLFSQLVPLMLRLASAAFFNISLLTASFWGVIIGVHVFRLSVHWMYPIAFVLIMVGLATYFVSLGVLGEAKKPWLGEYQENGVSGLGTARRTLDGSREVTNGDNY